MTKLFTEDYIIQFKTSKVISIKIMTINNNDLNDKLIAVKILTIA